MWIKLLKNLHFEGGLFIPAGSILWSRRAGKIEKQADGTFKQVYSVQTVEVDDLILVLSDEESLYEECGEPPAGYEVQTQTVVQL